MSATQGDRCRLGADSDHGFDSFSFEGKDFRKLTRLLASICVSVTLPSESVSHNWLYFVVVVVVDKWEAAFCFPLIHSLFSSVARRQLAIAAVLRFQSCSNCVGLT